MEQGIPPRSESGDPGNRVDAAPRMSVIPGTTPTAGTEYPRELGGRYTLGEVIGSGGSATVYRAWDAKARGDVAVKLFHSDLPESAQLRHQQELRIFRGLRHRGLVTLYGGGTYQGRTYLVMPLVAGPTLAERLARGPLSVEETIRIGAELADALAYLHGAEITHRDIKPANVLLGPDGAKLSDFGIARYREATQVTATGDVVGTAAYMAPEQVRSVPVGPKADIFALGLVLLECLTGRREYPGSIVESAVARLHRQPAIPDGLPGGFGDLLRRMTRQRPVSRPLASEVGVALAAAGGTRTQLTKHIRAPRFLPMWKRPRRVLAMFGLPAAVLAAAAVVSGSLGGPAPGREARTVPQHTPPSPTAPPTGSPQHTSTTPQPPVPATQPEPENPVDSEPVGEARTTADADSPPTAVSENAPRTGSSRGHGPPAEPGTPPTQPTGDAGNSAPGKSGGAPGQDGGAPGKSGQTPGHHPS